MARDLTALQRKALKARAHTLHPVVVIGNKGLTDAVLHEIDISLKSHELIKVRVAGEAREQREVLLGTICARLSALPVQHVGKVLVVYREQLERPNTDSALPSEPARRATTSARLRVPGEQRSRTRPRASAPRPAAATRAPPRARTR